MENTFCKKGALSKAGSKKRLIGIITIALFSAIVIALYNLADSHMHLIKKIRPQTETV